LFAWNILKHNSTIADVTRGAATFQKLGSSNFHASSLSPPFFPLSLRFSLPPVPFSSLPFSLLPASLPSFLSLGSLSFLGTPTLRSQLGVLGERCELVWAPLLRPGQSSASIRFRCFLRWKIDLLVSGDSGVEEVYRRRTSITSHNADQNFGVLDTFNPNLWGVTWQWTTPTVDALYTGHRRTLLPLSWLGAAGLVSPCESAARSTCKSFCEIPCCSDVALVLNHDD